MATMVLAEARLTRALESGIDEVTRSLGGPFVAAVITEGARRITLLFTEVILRGRELARHYGHKGLAMELALIEKYAPALGGELKRSRGAAAFDAQRARYLAAKFGRYWTEQAFKVAGEDASLSPSAVARKATLKQKWHVNMIGRSEAANAWNDEREMELHTLMVETDQKRRGAALALFQEWDAAMDKRTCPVCSEMSGTLRPVGMSFEVDPPPTHANCRCALMLVVLPVYFEWDTEPKLDIIVQERAMVEA